MHDIQQKAMLSDTQDCEESNEQKYNCLIGRVKWKERTSICNVILLVRI